ncbi:hypothetical protein JCM12298_25190 [Desulfothermus naphthae]
MNNRYLLCSFLLLIWIVFISSCGIKKESPGLEIKEPEELNIIQKKEQLKPNYLDLSKKLIQKGYYEIALNNLKKLSSSHEKDPEVFYLIGLCESKLHKYKDAERSFLKVLSLNKQCARAYNQLGLLYDLEKRHNQATKMYEQAISLNPARPEFYNNLGYNLLILKKIKKAKECFLKALAIDPANKKAINNLAFSYILSGQEKNAFVLLKKLYPTPVVYYNLGVLYEVMGRWEMAYKMYKKSFDMDPRLKKDKHLALLEEKIKKTLKKE